MVENIQAGSGKVKLHPKYLCHVKVDQIPLKEPYENNESQQVHSCQKETDKMDFTQILLNIQKKVMATPRKLPAAQIVKHLKVCQDLASVNALLKYCEYWDNNGKSSLEPSKAMAMVMMRRILILLTTSPIRTHLTTKDWSQIQSSFDYIRSSLSEIVSPKISWQKSFIAVALKRTRRPKNDNCEIFEDLIDNAEDFYDLATVREFDYLKLFNAYIISRKVVFYTLIEIFFIIMFRASEIEIFVLLDLISH